MGPYLVGLSHHTAPIGLRERLAFQPGEDTDFLEAATTDLSEGVLVSTCNRTEIYFAADDPERAEGRLKELLCLKGSLEWDELEPCLYTVAQEKAVVHLFRVTSGLDAMVVGETQIIGQVKEAFETARRAGLAGRLLTPLFQQALGVAARVQTETGVGHSAVSVGYAAVELARKVFGQLDGKRALLLGAGDLAELSLVHLRDQGIREILVANRSLEPAQRLAERVGGRALPFTSVSQALRDVDVVIGSTAAPHAILDAPAVAQVMALRRGRPLFIFDMAVPRDFDPAVKDVPGVFLYDIDDLRAVVDENLEGRRRQAHSAEHLVLEAARAFVASQKARRAVPLIRSLRTKADEIRRAELDKALRRMPHLSLRDREILEAMTALLVKKILNDPTVALKDMASRADAEVYLKASAKLFNLEPTGEDAAALDHVDGV